MQALLPDLVSRSGNSAFRPTKTEICLNVRFILECQVQYRMVSSQLLLMLALSLFPGIKLSETIPTVDTKQMTGLAWLEGEIYVITKDSNTVHVYPDLEPLDGFEEDNIKLEGMKKPWDMAVSKLSRSVFISDRDNRCLWRIQMPGRKISRWEVALMPCTMSTSSSDMLIVCVFDRHYYLTLYRPSDVMFIEQISLPPEVKGLTCAVQMLNGNFVISYSMKNDSDSYIISELSADGKNFIRSFDQPSTGSNQLNYWTPIQLSIDEDENIFVADLENDRVVLLNSRLTGVQILLKRDQHSIKEPVRLCYVREKQQLIVGQERVEGGTAEVRVFDLCPHKPYTDLQIRYLELIKSGACDDVNMNSEIYDRWVNMPGNKLYRNHRMSQLTRYYS